MKKITFLFALLCASVMGWAGETQYCNVTSPNANFTFSLMNVSGNLYRIQFDAVGDIKFASTPYNNNCGVNQTEGAGIAFGNEGWIMTDDRAYKDFTTATSTSVPTNFYGNYFCFNQKGGGLIIIENFNPSDVDWSATCGASCTDTQAPSVSAVAVSDITYNSAVLTITASDNTAVTRYVVKNGDTQIGQSTSNVITLSNLASGTTYNNIKVYAYDACNNESDAFSVTAFTTETITYCRYATGHLGNPNFGDIYGRILLTIKKVDNSTIGVKVEPNNNGTRGIKYLNIIVNGVGHEYGNNDGSGDDLTGYFNISGLESLNFNINIFFYCNTPNWTTQQFSVTEDQLCDESPVVLSEGSEYCGDYGVECDRHNGAYAYLKWETTEDGDVVITMVDGTGSTNARFCGNNGMGENLNGFTVLSGNEFATSEPASDYFTRVYVANGNTFKLQRKGGVILPSPAKIRFASPALEWYCTQDGDGYAWPTYEYTYGKICAAVSGYAVSASVNDAERGSATATVNSETVTRVDAGTTVTFTATPNIGCVFVNWTNGSTIVSTDPVCEVVVNEDTYLTANFDYIRNVYCHAEINSVQNKKLYLTLGAIGGGQYQIKIEGSAEAQLTGLINANYTINWVTTDIVDEDKKMSGQDVPFNNARWAFDASGYGSGTATFGIAEGHTWEDIYVWNHAIYFSTEAGEVGYTGFPGRNNIDWTATCADAEAPVFTKAVAEVLDESSVRLKIQATDNWEGLLTYTIARAGAEPIISNHASGEEFTQDVTGLTAGTEYDFTVTVSDGVNNANTHIVVTPVADDTKPYNVAASLVSKTWNTAIISVAADDDFDAEITKFRVVNATPAINHVYVASEGKITVTDLEANTDYNFTITALDAADNESELGASVAFKTLLAGPTAACDNPTWPADQVKAIYSPTYSADCNFGYWDSGTAYTQEAYGKKFVTAGSGYFGLEFINHLNCVNMEKLHLDIWIAEDASIGIVPIWGGGDVRAYAELTGQQWNSVDLDLSTDYAGVTDWSDVYQLKIDNAANLTFWIANAYFYRETAYVDNVVPTNFSASLAEESYISVKINAQAEDNSGAVIFTVKNGDDVVATQNAASAAANVINVTGLNAGTAYNFNVYVADEAGNSLEPIAVAATTKALPAAAPEPSTLDVAVKSIYSDTYASAIPVGINFNEWWWQSPTVAQEVSLGGNNARYYSGLNTNGSFGITWSGDHKLDAAGYQIVHFHIYPTNSATIEIYPVIQPEGEFHRTSQELIGGQWNEVVIDYSDKTFAPFNQFGIVYTNALGDFFIDNLYFYSDPDYTRDVVAGRYGTICLPQAGEIVGAALFEVAYIDNTVDKIFFDEIVSGEMEAGVPYIVLPEEGATQLKVFYTDSDVKEEAIPANGLVGSLASENKLITANAGNYILYNNQYWFVDSEAFVTPNHAYIHMADVPTTPSTSLPGRRRVSMGVNGKDAPQGFDNLESGDAPRKVLIEGTLYIIRGEKMYNANGQIVK